ncbi:MAG: hypothetical protein Q7S40_00855 [Opitutaceae bacterium]|nr:hypothetical protein [Opitutaceae bacterium]
MNKFTVASLLALAVAHVGRAETYVSTHSKLISEWPLALPAVVNGRAYVAAGLALEIRDVRIDGISQKPGVGGVARHDPSVYPHPVQAVVYRAGGERLFVARWKDGKRQEGLGLSYSLPCTAKKIDICYVIHSSRRNDFERSDRDLFRNKRARRDRAKSAQFGTANAGICHAAYS